MSDVRPRLLELLKKKSYQEGTFTLASGKQSDFFIDCKRTVLDPEGHALAGQVVLEALDQVPAACDGIDAIAAVPLGGCPLAGSAALLAFQAGCPMQLLYVRKAQKDHGTEQLVEGGRDLPPGARVALVEDVVTSGGSSLRAVETLRQAGYEVVCLVALVDRLEGGRESLESHGVTFHVVYTREDFVGTGA